MKPAMFFIVLLYSAITYSQQSQTDSLLRLLAKTKEDTNKVNLLVQLSDSYRNTNSDSSFLYADKALKISQSIGYEKGEIASKDKISHYSWATGDYTTAIKLTLPMIDYYKKRKDSLSLMFTYIGLLNDYRDQGDYKEALHYSLEALKSKQQLGSFGLGMSNAMVGSVYYEMNNLDSALAYLNKAVSYPPQLDMGWVFLTAGRIQAKMKNTKTAFQYYKQSINFLDSINNLKDLAGAYVSIGQLNSETGYTDSAVYFGTKALDIAQQKKFNKELLQSFLLLANAYEKTDTKKSLNYYH